MVYPHCKTGISLLVNNFVNAVNIFCARGHTRAINPAMMPIGNRSKTTKTIKVTTS